jgi:hypothetical protein
VQRRDGDYGEEDGDGVAGGGGTELGRHGLRLRYGLYLCSNAFSASTLLPGHVYIDYK